MIWWSSRTSITSTPGGWSWYTYDDLGNPVSQITGTSSSPTTTGGDGTVTEGAFDTSGIRVMRRVTEVKDGKPAAATTTVFLGDTEITFNPGSKSAQRTLTRSYTTPGGVPIASEEVTSSKSGSVGAPAWTWLAADQQQSIRFSRGPSGVKRTAYLPHGTPLGYGNNPAIAPGGRGYLNKTHDPNGDIRLDHRAYQPGLNVLTTPDPLMTPYDPQSLNPYAYSRNNPIGLSDPSGLNVADGSGPSCLTLNKCDPDTEPGDDEIQLPIADPSGDTYCNGYNTVCNGIVYPTNNYGAANNVLYINPETGRVTAYTNPDYVSPDYSWADFGKKVLKGTANFLILDAVRACANGDTSCALEVAAVFIKPVKGFKYVDDVADAAKTVPGPNGALRDVATGRFVSNPATQRAAATGAVHGNSRASQAVTYLYRLEDLDGNLLKWGITNNLKGRYSSKVLEDKVLVPMTRGSRDQMLNLERWIVERDPGPMNFERWAGAAR